MPLPRPPITAVLGPTNTGKTHLAIERMCAHSSGLIGFPLRLLAREVYDKVVALKGAHQVALITGEERIVPPQARWFLTTAESMPVLSGPPRRPAEGPMGGAGQLADFAFVALDEAQLGADPTRGHIFTDRLLHARGREETMLLGSASLAGAVRDLVPGAEIIGRPRFSTLRYAGMQKLSRLPKRSAIVAFSAEEVYAVAEMLRRFRGGAAVVMGALSPRTRNAQVAMFQAGEVDYIVATDAIGMGLNMDIDHVAFASLTKFDGQRRRRLTVAEMAQIAGRAGRHQRDGTFGGVGPADAHPLFTAPEVERIEEHRFDPVDRLFWREGDPPFDSIADLVRALERHPSHERLRPAPEAIDLAVLRSLAADPLVAQVARGRAEVRRLWDVCQVPDFQKHGAEHHARLVLTLWRHLATGSGHIPHGWFAGQIARLDNVQGDVETLAGRLAAVRIWAYVAQRPHWLESAAAMAERTRALEERLSDALHGALTQRFVDKRTAMLLRDMGRDASLLPVDVDPSGTVTVDGQVIGRLVGFRFQVDPRARAVEKRLMLAAAERRLGKVLTERAQAVLTASDGQFRLAADPGADAATIRWEDVTLATLKPGPRLLAPELAMDAGLTALTPDLQGAVRARVEAWMDAQFARHIPALQKMDAGARDPAVPAPVRAVLAQLADAGGIADRAPLDPSLAGVDKADRGLLRKSGVVIGVLDLYHPSLMKPGAAHWRMTLLLLRQGRPFATLPPAGAVLLKAPAPPPSVAPTEAVDGEKPGEIASPPPPAADPSDETGAYIAGFRRFGDVWLRIDIAERIARTGHEAIAAARPYSADDPHIVSIGLPAEAFADIMRQAGFRPVEDAAEGAPNWAFRGRPKPRPPRDHNRAPRSERPQRPDRAPREGGKGATERPTRQHRPPHQERPRQDRPSQDRQDGRGGSRAAPAGAATSKAFAGLADLLKRDE